jgi:putative transposase
MPSHLHLVVSAETGPNTLSDIMRDFKKFTSKRIVKSISEIAESRREWLLRHFAYVGKFNPKIKDYKFWQDGLHPIELTTVKFIEQKINYIHQNPVEAGYVFRAEDYVMSSAAQYEGEFNAVLDVIVLDLNVGIANPHKFSPGL